MGGEKDGLRVIQLNRTNDGEHVTFNTSDVVGNAMCVFCVV